MSERNPPADDLGWLPGAPATGFLLDRGQIELGEQFLEFVTAQRKTGQEL